MESTASEQQSKRPETTSKSSRSQDFADGSSAAKISRSTNDSLYRVNRRATTKTSSREELHKELIQQEISKNKLQKKSISLEILKLRLEIQQLKNTAVNSLCRNPTEAIATPTDTAHTQCQPANLSLFYDDDNVYQSIG